jgi:shikimate kinase
VLDPENRRLIRGAGLVVWLRASTPTLAARVAGGVHRPLLGDDPAAALARLDPERRRVYEEVAGLTVDVDDLQPDEICDRIAKALAGRQGWRP